MLGRQCERGRMSCHIGCPQRRECDTFHLAFAEASRPRYYCWSYLAEKDARMTPRHIYHHTRIYSSEGLYACLLQTHERNDRKNGTTTSKFILKYRLCIKEI